MRSPKAILTDEPRSNLDAELRVQMRTIVSRLQQRLATTTVYVTHDQTEAMTLGDRIVVMRGGRTQQIGAFRTALGDLPLPDEIRLAPEGRVAERGMIIGVRPEHFEDAELVEEHRRSRGVIFTTNVAVLGSMGSDRYAYFTVSGERAASADLADLVADAGTSDVLGGDGGTLATRLSAASTAREGRSADVWLDTSKVQVFDPETVESLRAG